MEYRGMSEQAAYHKGYLDGQAAMGDLLKSAPIKGPTYKLSESNSIDVLTQINKSQAKEIEGLKKLLELARIYTKSNKDIGITAFRWELNGILGTTQPEKGGD